MKARRIKINKRDSIEAIAKEISHTRNGNYKNRLMVIRSVYNREKAEDISKEHKVSRHTIFRWVRIYNRDGMEGVFLPAKNKQS